MDAGDKLFSGAIPQLYDSLLVPLIFAPYAEDLARRVAAERPLTVLEVAAGTGALTRAMAARLAETSIVATDLNPSMLDVAAGLQAGDLRIRWQQADALDLPFADEAFDVVVCQFGVMFFPDKQKAHGEALRVLRRGGHYLFNVWDRLSRNDCPDAVMRGLAEAFPADPPLFMERTPHGYHDVGVIARDVAAVGFRDVEVETVEKRCHGNSAAEVAMAFCQGTPMRGEIEARAPPDLASATEAAARALERRFGPGPIEGRMSAHVVSAARR